MNPEIIREKTDAIEEEMKKVGLWQAEALPEEMYDFNEAFGADKLSLAQWLQFIFIPRIRELIQTNGPWPEESEVGIYAAQQYMFFKPTENPGEYATQGTMDRKESKLVELLREFDKLFKSNV
ncbi:YqcC family protein [Candidatus Parcubacteria bacterium]|nr:YqcC family protein [Candidatus Parcubacteria bacterium]